MKRILIGIGIAVLALAGVSAARGESILLSWRAAQTEKIDLSALQARLEPYLIISLPENAGDGPYPVVLQFHGCAWARQPFQEMYARIANEAGYASVIVDSNRPRGLNRQAALDQVCSGKTLIGQERAGDVLAALDLMASRDDMDMNRVVLTGWSHGAWSIMDFLTMDLKGDYPATLADPYEKPLPRLAGTVLFYPYCGLGTRTRIKNWQQTPPTLLFIAGADTIVNHKACLSMADQLAAKQGLPVSRTVYPDTEHAFDDPFIEPDWQHWHNGDHMRDAMAQYARFLARLRDGQS